MLKLFKDRVAKNKGGQQWSGEKIALWVSIFATIVGVTGYTLKDFLDTKKPIGEITAVTVFVHGQKGCVDLILRENGFVIMRVEDTGETKKEAITDKGEAKFSGLRTGEKVRLQIDFSEPYRAIKPDSTYTVTAEGSICLEARLENLHRIFGRVIADDQPLPGAIVFINSVLRDTTDELGNYEIQIPPGQQQQEQKVTAFKPGYTQQTLTALPQTKQDLSFKLKNLK